jgi:hypothetical protein
MDTPALHAIMFKQTDIAKLLKYGFTSGFNMNYPVPRLPLNTKIIKCVLQYHVAAYERVEHEITLGRIARSFRN